MAFCSSQGFIWLVDKYQSLELHYFLSFERLAEALFDLQNGKFLVFLDSCVHYYQMSLPE